MEDNNSLIEQDISENKYPWLIPLKPKGDERSDQIRSLPKSPSETRSINSSISALKRLTSEQLEKKALSIIANPQTTSLVLAKLATELLELELTDKLKINLLGQLCKLYQTIHGSKSEVTSYQAKQERLDEWNSQLKSWYFASEESKKMIEENEKLKAEILELKGDLFIDLKPTDNSSFEIPKKDKIWLSDKDNLIHA